MTYRLIITGSRTWTDTDAIRDTILAARARSHGQQLYVVHGDCPCAVCAHHPCRCTPDTVMPGTPANPVGADAIAARIALDHAHLNIASECFLADWDNCAATCPPRPHRRPRRRSDVFHPGQSATYCPIAGPRRNQAMVDGDADETHAFALPCTSPGCPRVGTHDSHGTANCAIAAWKNGIPVVWHRPGQPVQEVLTP